MQVIELVLSRSRYTGQPLRLSGDRRLLGHALALGFRELEVRDAQSPVAARDARRVYVWQPMDHESAVAPADGVTRIESYPDIPGTAAQAGPPLKARHDMRGRTNLTSSAAENGATPAGEAHSPPPGGAAETSGAADGAVAASLTSVIREAEALHQALADAKRRAARLVAAPPEKARPARRDNADRAQGTEPPGRRRVARRYRDHVPPPFLHRGGPHMPMKLNVGVSRKLGLPDYSSVGASCSPEPELDSNLLLHDPTAFHAQVREAFTAAQQAVNDELTRLQAQLATPPRAALLAAHNWDGRAPHADGSPGRGRQRRCRCVARAGLESLHREPGAGDPGDRA